MKTIYNPNCYHIKFTTQERLNEIACLSNTKIMREMWDAKLVQDVEKSVVIRDISLCIAGVVQNLKTRVEKAFHMYPTRLFAKENAQNQEELGNKLKAISNEENEIFAIGGLSKSVGPIQGEKSIRLINFLKRPFKKSKKNNITIFFAQSSDSPPGYWPKTGFVYDKPSRTVFVNCQKNKNKKWNDVLNEKEIKDLFDIIKVSLNAKIYVEEKPVPNSFWNKNLKTH